MKRPQLQDTFRLFSWTGPRSMLPPQDALALLQWLFERRDRFQEAIEGDQPTTKLSLVQKRQDLPEWIQEEL